MATTVPSIPSLPRLPPHANATPEVRLWADKLVSALEIIIQQIVLPAQTYTVQNNSGSNIVRTIDCNAPVLATTTKVLATLIADLQNKGSLKR